MAIILCVGFIIGLFSYFKKLGQRDLNKKLNEQICKKRNLNFF